MLHQSRPVIGNGFGHRIRTGDEITSFLRELAADKAVRGITCAGKTDGGGAQVIAVMSTLAYARTFDVPYFHTPFSHIRFSDGQADWHGRWERFFNLGSGEDTIPNNATVMHASQYIDAGRPPGVIVRVPHCHNVIHEDGTADLYTSAIRDSFRKKYSEGTSKRTYEHPYIALHVRRGDVSKDSHASRYVSDTAVISAIINFKEATKLTMPIEVFSQGDAAAFDYLKDYGVTNLHLDVDVFESIHRMVCARGLIMGKSSFSYVAALLGHSTVATDQWYHCPLSDWYVKSANGRLATWGRSISNISRARSLHSLIKESPLSVIDQVEGDLQWKSESANARWMLALAYLALKKFDDAKPLLEELAQGTTGLAVPASKTLANRFQDKRA